MVRREHGDLVILDATVDLAAPAGALAAPGRGDVALDDGSLQEWSATPEPPVELGR